MQEPEIVRRVEKILALEELREYVSRIDAPVNVLDVGDLLTRLSDADVLLLRLADVLTDK